MAEKICRICHDDEEKPENPFISPCLCDGSQRFVHRECLENWRKTSDTAAFRCPTCRYEYQFSRLPLGRVLGSTAFKHVCAALTVTAVASMTGYVALKLTMSDPTPPYMYLVTGAGVVGTVCFGLLFRSGNTAVPDINKDTHIAVKLAVVGIGLCYAWYLAYTGWVRVIESCLTDARTLVENVRR